MFDVVGQPADHTADDEERCIEVARDAQHIVGEAAVIIDIAAHVDAFFFFQGLHGQLFEAVVEAEDIGHAFFLGQDAAVVAHDFGARVRQGVDGVAEAVDQAIVTAFEFLIEYLVDDVDDLFICGLNADGVDDLFHHQGDADIGAAVTRSLEGADRAGHAGVEVRIRRRDDDIGERRVRAAAVVGVEK